MDSSEARVSVLEMIIRKQAQQIADLLARMARAEQQPQNASGNGAGGGGGASSYIAYPASGIAVNSSASVTVYQCQGGAKTSLGTFTLYNYLNAAIVAATDPDNGVMCAQDGAGNYTALSQGCT